MNWTLDELEGDDLLAETEAGQYSIVEITPTRFRVGFRPAGEVRVRSVGEATNIEAAKDLAEGEKCTA